MKRNKIATNRDVNGVEARNIFIVNLYLLGGKGERKLSVEDSRQTMERIVEISQNKNLSPKDWGDTMEKIQYWYPEGIHLI